MVMPPFDHILEVSNSYYTPSFTGVKETQSRVIPYDLKWHYHEAKLEILTPVIDV